MILDTVSIWEGWHDNAVGDVGCFEAIWVLKNVPSRTIASILVKGCFISLSGLRGDFTSISLLIEVVYHIMNLLAICWSSNCPDVVFALFLDIIFSMARIFTSKVLNHHFEPVIFPITSSIVADLYLAVRMFSIHLWEVLLVGLSKKGNCWYD